MTTQKLKQVFDQQIPPTFNDFKLALQDKFDKAKKQGKKEIIIRAGDFHRETGGYPKSNHRMPVCCRIMRMFMKPGDKILKQPPKGNGANLIIKYSL